MVVSMFVATILIGWHIGDPVPDGCRVVRGRNGPMLVQKSPTWGKSHAVVGRYQATGTARSKAPVLTSAKPKVQWFPNFALKFDENMKPGVSINAIVLPSR